MRFRIHVINKIPYCNEGNVSRSCSRGRFGWNGALYRVAHPKVPKKQMEGVDTYTLHKPLRHKFQKNRAIFHLIDEKLQADLADLNTIP